MKTYNEIIAKHPDLKTFKPEDAVMMAYRLGRDDGREEVLDRWALSQAMPAVLDSSDFDPMDDTMPGVRDA